jgi:hypothetical protein
MSNSSPEKYSAEEWDHLRDRFFDSILNDTEIANLGQNLGISWPFKGADETPAKYIQYDFDELKSVPGLVGKASRIKTLMNILRETLAFDDPFSDMVDTVQSESKEDNTFERILDKLEIPLNYPSDLVHFKADTMELLSKAEDVHTLIDVLHFGQKLEHNAPVGSDLKNFLNGLAHKDELGVAKHLPYRRGIRGLHLSEAIGLTARDLPESAQLQLLGNEAAGLSEDEAATVAQASSTDTEAAIKAAVEKVAKACQWFTADAAELEQVFASGGSPERFFILMDDPRRERIAVQLSKLHLNIHDSKKSGLLGRIFRR